MQVFWFVAKNVAVGLSGSASYKTSRFYDDVGDLSGSRHALAFVGPTVGYNVALGRFASFFPQLGVDAGYVSIHAHVLEAGATAPLVRSRRYPIRPLIPRSGCTPLSFSTQCSTPISASGPISRTTSPRDGASPISGRTRCTLASRYKSVATSEETFRRKKRTPRLRAAFAVTSVTMAPASRVTSKTRGETAPNKIPRPPTEPRWN